MSEYDFNINNPPCQEYQPKVEESSYVESEPCELTIIIYCTAGCTKYWQDRQKLLGLFSFLIFN